jgi:hypothetical protein
MNRTAVRTFYTPLHELAAFYRALGDQTALAELQDQVRFFVRELTTPDTRHTGESTLRLDLDLNGDGVSPDYLPVTAVPHVWQGTRLYVAAMAAFGSRLTKPGDPRGGGGCAGMTRAADVARSACPCRVRPAASSRGRAARPSTGRPCRADLLE